MMELWNERKITCVSRCSFSSPLFHFDLHYAGAENTETSQKIRVTEKCRSEANIGERSGADIDELDRGKSMELVRNTNDKVTHDSIYQTHPPDLA